MTWRQLMAQAREDLLQAGIEEYESDVRVLAMHVLGCSYSDLILRSMEEATEEEELFFTHCISVRATHMPCQYITGTQDFMGYCFRSEPEVLIPRPETELLVETALGLVEGVTVSKAIEEIEGKQERACKALDLCCGSGCIGISFRLKRMEQGFERDEVTLADISDAAIRVSKDNNESLQAGCRVVKTDLFENLHDRYDIIMSNPPYIPTADIADLMPDVRDFEPHLALDGKEDGLYFYDRIIKEAGNYLYDGGYLVFEIGYDQYEAVRERLFAAGYMDISLKKDYAGLDRIVIARYDRECKRG